MKKSIYALLVALTAISSPVFMAKKTTKRTAADSAQSDLLFKEGGKSAGMMRMLAMNPDMALGMLIEAVRTAREADILLTKFEKKKIKQEAFLQELSKLVESQGTHRMFALLPVVRPIIEEVLANQAVYTPANDATPLLLDLAQKDEAKRVSHAAGVVSELDQAKDFLMQLRALRQVLRANLNKKKKTITKKATTLSEEDADLLFN